ncbi:tRNA uridine-5-carboxymethylaminomethyl(34) synthesis GTPase MnmE [Aurantibacillus circumpalustris]|uniref:tRNA uridine-5-carboxymethylaminomethyl(34) synthesis GTPase MnmE n=1 Tax=Aurantibacillus circumpalustris TaxID=3036359 RepID=UPI00295C1975|nr:tRNA uridine-5-carboxymethylaminomethyl(34) synthesis GTPase MnmE [Aurantibacillus circumpalustris]
MKINTEDTIVALATAHGSAAIAVIRLSGPQAIQIVDQFFYTKDLKKKSLIKQPSHTANFGILLHEDVIIDEVIVTLFIGLKSYTGQNSVEVSCHGSPFIQQQLLKLFLNTGARMAQPGEFTMRAFLNQKLDLSQAEAVADLIASNSSISHQVAMQQMRGGFSDKIKLLRNNLVNFASLIELELDFSEEDVEFADRTDLKNLVTTINSVIRKLGDSFEIGNVIKNGIPVAIVGKPNAGKSTLLNVLLEDDRAIVSEIPGTTRDTIEDEIIIEGVLFRFIDTAGLRITSDIVEQIGVNRALEVIRKSAIIIYLFDAHTLSSGDLKREIDLLSDYIGSSQLVIVANKIDTENQLDLKDEFSDFPEIIYISAKGNKNVNLLKQKLVNLFDTRTVDTTDTIVTNARHANSLKNASEALNKVINGLNENIPSDLLALDIRYALDELGAITGEVTNEDLLENIFTKFCIGK